MVTVCSDLELDQFTELIGNGLYLMSFSYGNGKQTDYCVERITYSYFFGIFRLSTCGLAVDTTLESWIGSP